MTTHPYSQLVRYKQWADHGLYQVVTENVDRLNADHAAIMLRILDHIYSVDQIFRHHLLGLPHEFNAPRSDATPDLHSLAERAREVDDWYVSYVAGLSSPELDQPVEFAFTNGAPARMRRGEIILHVCQHGIYHRGNAGVLLQQNGVTPNDDRMTDYLETAA